VKRRRIVVLMVVVAAIALVALLARHLRGAVEERARRALESRASEIVGGRVAIARLRFSFLPPGAALEEVTVYREGNRGSQATAAVGRITVGAGPLTLLGLRRGAVNIAVDRPGLRLVLAEGRPLEIKPGEPAASALLAHLPDGTSLDVKDATLDLGIAGGPEARLTGVMLEARADAAQGAVRGRIEWSGGSCRGLVGNWEGLRGAAAFETSAGGIRLDPLTVRGEGMALSGRLLAGPSGAEGEIRGSLEIARLTHLLPPAASASGRLEGRLEGSWRDGAARARGDLSGAGLALWGFQVDSLRSELEIGDALRLTGIRAHLFGGEASGAAQVVFGPDGPRAEGDIRLDGVDLAQVLQRAGWQGPAVNGTIHYRGTHRLGAAGLATLGGSGVIEAVGHYRPPRGTDLPLEITSSLTTDGAAIVLSGGTIHAGSVRGSFSGRVTREDGVRLRLSGATGDISQILPLFTVPKPPAAPRPGGARKQTPSRSAAEPPARVVRVRLIAWSAIPPPAGARARGAAAPSATAAPAAAAPPAAAGLPESPLEKMLGALGGRWEWTGDLHYDEGGLSFEGRLFGSGLIAAGAELGSLEASVLYAEERLAIREATLRVAGGGTVRLSGEVIFQAEGSIAVRGEAADCPVAPLLALAGVALPIDGRLDGRITLGGRPDAPAGRVSLQVASVRVAGVPFDGLKGDILFTRDFIEVRDLVLSQGSGSLRVEGPMAYRGDPAAVIPQETIGPPRLTVTGTGLDLGAWAGTIGGPALRGTAEIEGTIGGSIAAPSGFLRLRGAAVTVGGRSAGDLEIEAEIGAEGLRVRGALPRYGVTAEGRIARLAGWPVDLALTFTRTELKAADVWSGAPEDLSLFLSGRADLSGPLARRPDLSARVRLDHLAAVIAGISVTAQGPVEATLQERRLRLLPLVLAGDGTRVEVHGSCEVAGGGPIDLAARGTFDLKLLRPLVRHLQATGRGEIEMAVGGTRDRPSLSGTLKVAAQAIRVPEIPFPIDGLEAGAVFQGSEVRIESLRFLAGGGPVEGTGRLELSAPPEDAGPAAAPRGGVLFAVRSGEVRLRGQDVKAEFPDGFRSVMDLDVVLRQDREAITLGGALDLVKGVYSRDFRIESSLIRGRAPEIFDVEPEPSPLSGVRLDLRVRTSGEVWLRNDFGSIEGQGSLLVGGTMGRPTVAGRITAVEGGMIRFRNVRYRVQSGTIDFSDPETIDPLFNLVAETQVAEYQVTLRIEGTVEDFRYDLTSNPPLPQPDIVALLLTGRTLGTLGPEGAALAEETVSGYLAGRLTEELSERLSGRAGLDVIAIDPLAVNGQGDPTTRVTIGKQVTPELFVTYSNELGSTQGSIYQLDYSLGRDFKFTSVRDRDGSIGGDLKFILRGAPPLPPAASTAPGPEGGPAPASGAVAGRAARPSIGAIRLEGHPHFKPGKVRRILGLKPGRQRDRAAVNDAIERLLTFYRGRGFLMAEVDYDERPGAPGTVDLSVHINPGPRIGIEFEGTGSRSRLRSMIAPYWEKGIFLEDIIEAAATRLRAHFRDQGHLSAEVASRVVESTGEAFRVRFTVRRGSQVQAQEVRVAGARQIPEAEVLKVVRTRPDTIAGRGIVRDSVLRDDVTEIRALYLGRGFPEVSVPTPDVILDASGRRASVVFHVEEGPRVEMRAARFEGAAALVPETLDAAVALAPGTPYTAEAAEQAVARLRRAYDDAGYPEARVRYRIEPAAGPEHSGAAGAPAREAAGPQDGGAAGPPGPRSSDLVFAVDEGARKVVRRVEVRGNYLTRDGVVREAVTVGTGDPLSRGDLLASQTRLYERGIFTSVTVEADETQDPGPAGAPRAGGGDAAPQERNVRVTVREAAPLTQVFGVGYDTEDKARGQYEIANRNIAGTGRYLGLQTRASGAQQRASVLYREQGLFGGRFDGLASAFWEDEDRPAFDVRTVGSSLQISRQLNRATRTLYRLSLRDVNLSDAAASFEGTTLRLSNLSASALHDTRDALFDPLRGHYLSAEAQFFGRAIGSEAEFTKIYAQVFLFREILPRTVWAQALRAGAASPFGRSERDPTLTGDLFSGVPPSERFFAGGDTTVRGFRRDRLGPIDPDPAKDDPIGGEGIFLINEELRFPIFKNLQGVVFYDAGNVFQNLDDYDLTDLRHVAGLGLRLATPIGPFRVEYGAILDREPDEPRGEFFLSIGQAF
jgi:outer membrane protein assembly factor BamA